MDVSPLQALFAASSAFFMLAAANTVTFSCAATGPIAPATMTNAAATSIAVFLSEQTIFIGKLLKHTKYRPEYIESHRFGQRYISRDIKARALLKPWAVLPSKNDRPMFGRQSTEA
ncbi:hypothetical protein N7E02_01095 (plasmid) [Aliirhizobium terrae]|uniref:hypothetical protein n=1 Tax=Terrirhizobium terrae TaxID=2926709 RepID=UPI0025790100|nr:hypothetical protein [Rhizobium sp. CC-CFT758]WJH38204.1 hypothetical protein N7E02_01095 [Rhizobium sp. CC-CFT758]